MDCRISRKKVGDGSLVGVIVEFIHWDFYVYNQKDYAVATPG